MVPQDDEQNVANVREVTLNPTNTCWNYGQVDFGYWICAVATLLG